MSYSLIHTGKVLSVRDFSLNDIPLIDDYWARQSPSDLQRMKIDPSLLRSLASRMDLVERSLATPDREKEHHSLVWLMNGEAVGSSALRNIRYGDYAEIHLQMFFPELQGKGYGQRLFSLSVVEFARRFQLKLVVCEPSSSNPNPNALLQKLGARLVKSYLTTPSAICFECEVNRYEMDAKFISQLTHFIESQNTSL